ncbi:MULTISPECIES: hypothetical protein [Actinomadura]|jgi:hypothetical protein|uniref:Uncharacterized protein n=1 Tax=Actinomadura citrea TaxID=46158 RepID=A0A7Y9G4H7_9ACTN|nr:hypothetical protein [Actinomadura citrea]NYE09719.1 hypothetical protein [Actinomadura citrea]GGT62895.1 hypothetical protein GCM10010177_19920 [Actinomadura citrea]
MSTTPSFTTMNASDLAEILFTSPLQESDRPSAEQVRTAINARLGACGGDSAAWVAAVAQEAGDHPETYLARMRWALSTVHAIYPDLTTAA